MKLCKCTRNNDSEIFFTKVRDAGAKVGAFVEIKGTDNPHPMAPRVLWRIIEVQDITLEDQTADVI